MSTSGKASHDANKETKEQRKTNYYFEKLTPVDDTEISIYRDALEFVFQSPDVKNIAISGAYGSGKSSVLATYKKENPEKNFIHISLAHFQSADKSGDSVFEETTKDTAEDREKDDGDNTANRKNNFDTGERINEVVLEGKILNQLIHQLDDENIPQTNFRIKRSLSTKQIVCATIRTVLFIVTLLHLSLSYVWINFIDTFPISNPLRNILELTTTPLSFLISGLIGLIIVSCFVFSCFKSQRYKSAVKKLSLQGNDIELFEKNNESFFDKYLNEVLYLFENADVDAIVFEDMDRYQMEGIFERLREVNALANIRLQRKNKKTLRFIFLLRDDIFISKDRTKFFDYILPVVPVVDSSNSYDQLIEHLSKNNLHRELRPNFLQGLSLYIDDMRLLKNICNEFLIYYYRLKSTELDPNKLLAVIAYKNLFPRDFSALQISQGFVFTVFSKIETFIKLERETLQEKISEIENTILEVKSESLLSLRELDAVYADRHFKNHRLTTYSDSQLTDWISSNLSGDALTEYNHRREILEIKLSGNVSSLEDRITELKYKTEKIKHSKLSQIITRENIDAIFSVTSKNSLGEISSFDNVKRNQYFDLLKFLIRNGYIDESYADYMTYFYPNSITTSDKIFLQSITNKVSKGYSYEIKKPELVFPKLSIVDFDEEEVLNFSLLTYMLKTKSTTEALQRLILQVKKKEKFDFISQYYECTPVTAEFVKVLNKLWPEFFSTALAKNMLPTQQLWNYAHDTLYYSNKSEIKGINIDNILQKFISASPDFLSISPVSASRFIDGLLCLGIKFISINYHSSNSELFTMVYENDSYVINAENIFLMLSVMYSIHDEDSIKHKSFSLILSNTNAPLYKYIIKEIDSYVSCMLELCNEYIEDTEDASLTILNHSDITISNKQKYIQKLTTKITSLLDVKDKNLWSLILNSDSVRFTEENLFVYWLENQTVDDSLIAFINKFDYEINMSSAISNYENDIRKSFFISILSCPHISNDKYIQILSSMNLVYSKGFDVLDIPNDKVVLLMEKSIIRMTPENLESIRTNYPNLRYHFIRIHLKEYFDIMTEDLIDNEETSEILSWDIDDDKKLSLLNMSNVPISIIDKKYSLAITLYILENLYDERDTEELFLRYSIFPDKVKQYIKKLAITKITQILNGSLKADKQLRFDLLGCEELSEDSKYNLLLQIIPEASKDFCYSCFEKMGLTEFLKVFDTHSKPKILKTQQNEKVLQALVNNMWIFDYPDNQYDNSYYTVRRNPPRRVKN